MNYKQKWIIEQKIKKKLLENCPTLTNNSGIYILTRTENGINFAYIGQAVKLCARMISHLQGYSHIDLSLKKRGLWSKDNVGGWNIDFFECEKTKLDIKEQETIKEYATMGYQLYNITGGGQGAKTNLFEGKTPKGYYDGVEYGEIKALRKIKTFFDKYIDFTIKGKINKIKQRKYEEFKELLNGIKDNGTDNT